MEDSQTPVPVAVIGVGRMGQHHARTYRNLGLTELVAVVDFDIERAQSVADEYGCKAYNSVEKMLKACPRVKAATVAVPTQYHAESAYPLMQKGIACLIEKPLAVSAKQAADLVAFGEDHQCMLQVGHTERFNPAVRALAAMQLTPRFIEVTRVSPMTFRSLDVGVVMDMMIHDLDIVLSLVDRPITKVQAVGISVIGEHEDVCDARLTFEGGCVATIKGSRMAMQTERRLRLFCEDAYVTLDYGSRQGTVVRSDANASALKNVQAKLASGADLSDENYLEMLEVEPLAIDLPDDEQDQLTAQAKAFVHAITSGDTPVVTGQHACNAVDAAEKIVAAINGHSWDTLSKNTFIGPA